MNAKVYRMVTDEHICPYGIKAVDLLKRYDIDFEDNHLKNREQTEKFKKKYAVSTTPQIFIDDERIGGFDQLAKYLGAWTLKQEGLTYQPVIAVFASTSLMAAAQIFNNQMNGSQFSSYVFLKLFVAYSMAVLAILKLRDLYSFTNQFVSYDILARKYVPYGYLYPFLELLAGIGMILGSLQVFFSLVSLTIGLLGSASVIKAVYVEKRDIKCACVGGNSNVPLGAVSLTENLMMVFMGVWMLLRSFV